MQHIEEIVKEIQEQIQEFRDDYLSNELAVRAQLIDPVLIALGWKTSNPKFVRHNAPFNDGKIPDYTLLKDSKNRLIIEAKNLSIKLTDQKVIDQLSHYCYNQGVDFGILTNGLRWLLFSTFQKNPQDRIVWQVDLEKDSVKTVSRNLSSFSFENIEKLDELLQKSKALEGNWTRLISSTNSIVAIIAQKLNEEIKASNPKLYLSTDEINSFTRGKLIEHFDSIKNEDNEKYAELQEDDSKETEFSTVEDSVFKREKKSREKIAVIFPDGVRIYSNNVSEVFVETIKKIGVERVKQLGIKTSGIPLVSDNRLSEPRYNQHQLGNYWIMVTTSTPTKHNLLDTINTRLNLNLKIERFTPDK